MQTINPVRNEQQNTAALPPFMTQPQPKLNPEELQVQLSQVQTKTAKELTDEYGTFKEVLIQISKVIDPQVIFASPVGILGAVQDLKRQADESESYKRKYVETSEALDLTLMRVVNICANFQQVLAQVTNEVKAITERR